MASLDLNKLLPVMTKAAAAPLQPYWPTAKDYVEAELKKLGQTIVFIESQVTAGRMTDEQALLHLMLQKQASKTVLLATEGLGGAIPIERSIDDALHGIAGPVNTALGLTLIPPPPQHGPGPGG